MSNERRFRLNFKCKLKDVQNLDRIPISEIIEAKDLHEAIFIGVKKVKEYDRILTSIHEV